jgi:prepilin peptidase CpaA
VPNPLTASLTASGLVFAAAGISGLSVSASILGCVLGLALMLPGHLFGATGAGDVKLFAAAGALIGPAPIVTAFFYTALAGGLLALAVAVRRQPAAADAERRRCKLVATAAANSSAIAGPLENNRFAYAPAIAVGNVDRRAGAVTQSPTGI